MTSINNDVSLFLIKKKKKKCFKCQSKNKFYEVFTITKFIILHNQIPGLIRLLKGPGHAKMHLMPYANNKDAEQPAH